MKILAYIEDNYCSPRGINSHGAVFKLIKSTDKLFWQFYQYGDCSDNVHNFYLKKDYRESEGQRGCLYPFQDGDI